MRAKALLLMLPLVLAACGTTERTVVVNPPPTRTVLVNPDGSTDVVVHHDRDVEVVR